MAESRESEDTRCSGCGNNIVPGDRFCESCGLRQPAEADRIEQDLDAVAGVTDRGLIHSRNEDAMALRTLDGMVLAVISDGVSTSDRPDQASRLAVRTAADLLAIAVDAGVDLVTATGKAAVAAAAAVTGLAGEEAERDEDRAPACTYVSAVITADTVTIGWVGDSRAYWLDAGSGASELLTVDDSWATEAVATGWFTPEQAAADPRAHALTRWLGADAEPDRSAVHVTSLRPTGPGVVLLCSDGLWNYCPGADDLATIVMPNAVNAPLAAAKTLVQYALLHGGHDNITAVVTPFPPERKTT